MVKHTSTEDDCKLGHWFEEKGLNYCREIKKVESSTYSFYDLISASYDKDLHHQL